MKREGHVRERMLTRLSGWLLGGVLLVGAAGCGGASQAPAATTGGGAAPGGEAKPKVDKVIIAMPAPARESNNANADLDPLTVFQLRPMLEWLVGYGTDGEFEPMLAKSWSVGPDGKSLKFALQQGVQFHNDKGTFSADDVLYSYQQMVREDSIHPHAPIHRAVKLEKTGEYEVTFTMARPNAEYLHQLSRETGSMAITSKADAESLGNPSKLDKRPLAGTGAYQFKERDQGRSISFTRVPYKHYRVTPDFPELELRWMAEASTRLAGLLTNEIHITQLPQDLTPQAEAKGMKTVRGPVTQQRTWLQYYGMYVKDPKDRSKGYVWPDSALMDVRVRKALDKAIDRDALNKAFFANKGELMIVDPMHPSRPGWDPALAQKFKADYGYDPEGAKKLLAEAGKAGFSTTIIQQSIAGFSGAEDMLEAMAGMWRNVGIKVDIISPDAATVTTQGRALAYDNHITVAATSAGGLVSTFYHSTMESRGAKLEDADIQKVVDELYVTLDEKKSADLWKQLGEVVYDKYQIIPLFWLPAEATLNTKIVADYPWPGSISGTWTHVEYIKAAK